MNLIDSHGRACIHLAAYHGDECLETIARHADQIDLSVSEEERVLNQSIIMAGFGWSNSSYARFQSGTD